MAVPAYVVIGKDDGGNPIWNEVIDTGLTNQAGQHIMLEGSASIARPTDVGLLGAYGISTITGTMAANLGGGSPVYSFRWSPTVASQLALIKRVAVAMSSLGTGFTAGVGLFNLFVARGFTISDTGGNALAPFNPVGSQKYRTAFAASGVADLRQSSTGTLTAGTRTLDANPHGGIMFAVSTALNTVMLQTTDILKRDQGAADWPLILAANEGFVIQATVPATGTWQMQVLVDWLEVPTF